MTQHSSFPLQELAEGIFDGPHATPPESTEGPIFLRLDNITPEGRLDLSDLRFIAPQDYPRWTRRVTPQAGDVVFSYEATLHRYVVVPEGFHGCLGRRLALIRPNRQRILSEYLHYYFLTDQWRRTAASAVINGATVDRISLLRVRKLPVLVPSLSVQRRVVESLSAYDALIENNRRRMALLEESARCLYQEWFVHLRFPGHEHTRITDGAPEGWRKVPLRAITTKIGSGATPRGGEASYLSEGIPLIRSLNVYDDHFQDEGLAFISEEQAAGLANVIVASRDILLNITGASVCRCCMAPERYLPARVNQHVMIIRVNPAMADPFVVHKAINSDEKKRQLLSYAQKGSTREALTKEMMAAFEIMLPARELMRQYGEIAEATFRQRENLALQNQKLRSARDLLLPRLMSGEVAV